MDNFYLNIVNKNKEQEIASIRKCNEYTEKYGLILTDTQIKNIIKRKEEILKETGRIELRESIMDKLIKEFCDSPYISNENYEETLYELLEIFYNYKNETMDFIADEELIKFMKESFDNICNGDLEYLSGTVLPKMKENLQNGKPFDFKEEEGELNE